MKKRYANIMLVVVTVVWGGGFIATSTALDSISPFYIMMIRFLGASILPGVLCFKKLRHLDRSTIYRGIFTGVLLFLAFSIQTFGLKYSTPSKNAFLTATNVVFVPYLLWFLMHRCPKRKEIIASLMCVVGIALLTLKPDALSFTIGDVLSLLCALFFALHMIYLGRFTQHVDVFVMTFLQMFTAGILGTICALCFEQAPSLFDVSTVGSLLYLILFSTMLAYLLQTYAQKFTSANSASLILSMEALWASIFSFLFFQEMMSLSMIVGACLIFTSILYIEYKPKSKRIDTLE